MKHITQLLALAAVALVALLLGAKAGTFIAVMLLVAIVIALIRTME